LAAFLLFFPVGQTARGPANSGSLRSGVQSGYPDLNIYMAR